MKLIAVATANQDEGEFVFTSLHEAVANGRARLADVGLAYRDEHGDLTLSHTKGRLARIFGSGIDDESMKRVAEKRPDGAFVFALGEVEAVAAVARRVNTVTRGSMKTYAVDRGSLSEITEQDATFALSGETAALLEDSEAIATPRSTLQKSFFS